MSGFILGTATGVAASGAVYYVMSVQMREQTALLRDDLARQNAMLHASFDPQAPPAAAALVGPTAPHALSFPDLLRIKWNQAIERTVLSARDTDWNGVAAGVVEAGRDVGRKLSGDAQDAAAETRRVAHEAKEAMKQDVDGLARATGQEGRRIFHVTEKPDSPGAWNGLRDGAGVGPGAEETGANLREGAQHLAHEISQKTRDFAHELKRESNELGREISRESKELGREARDASRDVAHDVEGKTSAWAKSAGSWFRKTKEQAKDVSNAAMDNLTDAPAPHAAPAPTAWQEFKKEATKAVSQVTGGKAHVVGSGRDLRGETFTGGPGPEVRAKREYERTALGRLV